MNKTAAETDHSIGYFLKVRDWACLGLTICCLLGLPVVAGHDLAESLGYSEGYETCYSNDAWHCSTEEVVVRLGQLNESPSLHSHTSNFYIAPSLHKNGRLIDPSSYVHRTIRRSHPA